MSDEATTDTPTLTPEQRIAMGQIPLNDKWYATVPSRVAQFRSDERFANWSMTTKINHGKVSILAETTIADETGRVIANGHSEKPWRDGRATNREGVERTETASIGRALASLGFLADAGMASVEEVFDAVSEERDDLKEKLAAVEKHRDRLLRMIDAMSRNLSSIAAVRERIKREQWELMVEAYYEITEDDRIALNVAPTKGGWLTTTERGILKDDPRVKPFKDAYFGRETESDDE